MRASTLGTIDILQRASLEMAGAAVPMATGLGVAVVGGPYVRPLGVALAFGAGVVLVVALRMSFRPKR